MHQTSLSSAPSGSLRRFVLAGLFLLFSGTAASAQCDTPTFSAIPLTITAYTTATTCSPALTIPATLANPTGVTLSFNLNGATLDSGLGIGSGHIFNRGITHLTITATKACVTKKFFIDVIVKDTIKPVLSHADITVNATAGLCGAYVPYAAPSFTDNCPNCSLDFLMTLGFEYLGSFGGHLYFLTPKNLKANFDLVDAQGGGLGAHLASINSAAENAFLDAAIPDSVIAWFGYTDRDVEGVWKWTDGSTSTFTNWCDNEPDDLLMDQDFAIINSGGLTGPAGCWDDAHLAIFPPNGPLNNFQGIIEIDICGTSLVKIAGLDSNAFFPIGTTKVTYLGSDASGNVDSVSFNVTVLGSCVQDCEIGVTPSNNTYTGGVPTNIYLGYGPQSATLTASAPCVGPTSYLWTGPTSLLSCTTCQSPVFTPTAAGNYTFNSRIVCGTDTFRCSVTFCVKNVRGNTLSCGNGNHSNKIIVCHKPPGNPTNVQTLCLPPSAIPAHLGHGCSLGDCSDLCATTARVIRGNNNVIGSEVKVYPNPATNTFYLELPYFEIGATVTLMDIQGKVLQTRSLKEADDHKLRFDLGNNSNGIYMLDITYDDHRYRTKVVVQ